MGNEEKRKVIYGLDDKPKPFIKAFGLGIQHVLTMFGATVSVPLLLGPMMGMTKPEIGLLVTSVMLCSGIATLFQIYIGSRLPIVQGVSWSFLGPFLGIIAVVGGMAAKQQVPSGPLIMQYIAGAILLGAIVEMIVGWSGLIGRLEKILTPVVIGPVIMLIGLALFKYGAPKAGTYWPVSILVIVCIFLFSQVLSRKYNLFKIFPILAAIIAGYLVCAVLSATGTFSAGHPCHIDLTPVREAAWLRIWPIFGKGGIVFPWGLPKFSFAFFLCVLAGYLASMIESFGDYHACAYMSGYGDYPTPKMISRGIGSEGLGCFCTSILGGFASTSYSENIGLIGITKVGSRYVVMLGALFLIFLGIFAKFGALVATIPVPIIGALYCALFGLISAVGIRQLSKADLNSDRNLMIAGFSLFMGLSLPAYFDGKKVVIESAAWLADIINIVGSTGMAVAAVLGLILDNIIPGTPEERGMQKS
ncbi:MAG: solute carrier family 23 protein [bacterium]